MLSTALFSKASLMSPTTTAIITLEQYAGQVHSETKIQYVVMCFKA